MVQKYCRTFSDVWNIFCRRISLSASLSRQKRDETEETQISTLRDRWNGKSARHTKVHSGWRTGSARRLLRVFHRECLCHFRVCLLLGLRIIQTGYSSFSGKSDVTTTHVVCDRLELFGRSWNPARNILKENFSRESVSANAYTPQFRVWQ